MGQVINLNKARKQRNRDDKDKKSAVKRVKFGQSKADKTIVDLDNKRDTKKLDDHKREPSPDDNQD